MPDPLTLTGAFIWGILRRFYLWAPTFLLDAADYQDRYIEPRLGWSIDLPSEAFPIALAVGFFFAALFTYVDIRSRVGKPDVVFEVRDCDFGLDSFDRGRPEQPFHLAQVTLTGQLRNRADVRADVEGVRIALMERGWFWIWRKVGDEQPATKLLNPLRAVVDPYYHGVSVDAKSRSRDISEVWAYPSIPVWLKPESRRAHRLRITVDAYGQNQATPTYVPIDLPSAFRIGKATFDRIHRMRGESIESTQSREGSHPREA